ncbi:hypothetical protein CEXT_188731 [Caerostris extrusa]|uniref:Uncharacterized protein n=1 Tax=Caerostris extrusa TaxID=172846 RepID=A0AAV4XFH3_CAEEX|nr:hypothetical protein CEXT_188731 [Caerostris extrusa]
MISHPIWVNGGVLRICKVSVLATPEENSYLGPVANRLQSRTNPGERLIPRKEFPTKHKCSQYSRTQQSDLANTL